MRRLTFRWEDHAAVMRLLCQVRADSVSRQGGAVSPSVTPIPGELGGAEVRSVVPGIDDALSNHGALSLGPFHWPALRRLGRNVELFGSDGSGGSTEKVPRGTVSARHGFRAC